MKLRYKILNGILIVLAVAIGSLMLVLSHTKSCGPAPEVAAGVQTMKAVRYRCYGAAADVLEHREVEKPTPADNEVLVRVHAAAINPLDYHYMRGSPYLMRLAAGIGAPEDTRLGVDFSGTVEAVGSSVSGFQPGDAVFGGRSGAFGEYVIVPEDRAIASKPANVSFEEAAAVPIAAVTALQALRDHGKLQAGQSVLINGASGGVGTFAVQIAKSMGATVSGVCSTRNVEMVRSLGADHVIDYKKESYLDGGQQFDLVVDMVGNYSPMANRRVLKPNGILVLVGGPKGNWVAPLIRPLQAIMLSVFVDEQISVMLAELRQEDLQFLAELMESGQVRPTLDRSYPLDDLADAIEYSESGRARGKIIVQVL